MEIWFNTDSRRVRLPVLPSEMIISGNTVETNIGMLGLGELSLYGGNKPREGEISCFFPSKRNLDSYGFLQYKNVAEPYFFASIFRNWMDKGQVVQFIVAPSIASFPVRIISFEYGEKNGSGDVYYTLKWKEARKINVKKLNTNSNNSNANNERPPSQTQDKSNSSNQKTHTVKHGESLWLIAQKYYGNGSQYPKIKNANSNKYPSLKNNNIIYSTWVLVIP